MGVKEMPNGFCTTCKTPKFKQEGVLICPNCDVEQGASKAVNDLEDPGHEAMEKILKAQKPEDLPTAVKMKAQINIPVVPKDAAIPQARSMRFDEILAAVEGLPMPDDMKSIKKLLKVKQLLKELAQ